VSAGHSLRRQNYSFATVTPTAASHRASRVLSLGRFILVALVLDVAAFAAVSMLIAGR
jgi:hypothetical protein